MNRVVLISGILLGCLHSSQSAIASIQLEKMEAEGGKNQEVTFSFSGEIKRDQVQVEYAADSVSLLIDDALIYPSKMLQTSGEHLKKVFAYQYSPKQVRCKLSLKGKPESYKSNLDLNVHGKVLSLGFGAPASRPESHDVLFSHEADREERQLLERVTQSSSHPVPPQALETAPAGHAGALPNQNGSEREKPGLGVGKHVPSFQVGLTRLVISLLILGGLAAAAHFVLKRKGINVLRKIGRGSNPWMEVLGTQPIGPRKSIMLVKISGRTLALGVTEHSIQTLSDFSSFSEKSDAYFTGESQLGGRDFDDALLHEAAKPNLKSADGNGVRGRIRSRVEGLKPL